MGAIGIVLTWFGYSVFYYGLNVVTGGNDSFLSLVWPGRYTPTPRDQPGGGSSGPANAPGAGNLVQPPGTYKGSPTDADPNNPQPGPIPHRPGF